MEQPAEIDPLAMCASPFAAPIVLALFGLIGSIGQFEERLLSLLFWQVLLAIEWTPLYLVVSLPLGWLLWRLLPAIFATRKSFLLPLLVAISVFTLIANARYFGIKNVGPLELEVFTFIVGVLLNVTALIWLQRRLTLTDSAAQ